MRCFKNKKWTSICQNLGELGRLSSKEVPKIALNQCMWEPCLGAGKKNKKMFSSLCIDAFLPKGKKSRKMYKNTRGRGKRHKMDKQMWDKNKRHSRQRKAKKLRRHLFQYLSFLDMHILHRKVLKWISAKKNSYTQLLCLQIISKNSNYLCLWQWEAIIHNGPLFSPAPVHSFLDGRNKIDILETNTRL